MMAAEAPWAYTLTMPERIPLLLMIFFQLTGDVVEAVVGMNTYPDCTTKITNHLQTTP